MNNTAGTVRCPASTHTADGTPHTTVGCGAQIPDIRDDEGLVDCLECGIWFDPDKEC